MGMILDGVFASEQPDSSAEIVVIKGADISDLQAGRATANWEHLGDKDPGHSANDHVGRVTYAKKIFTRGDCSNAREREYWDFVQVPFIYGKVELFNDEGHPGAVACAAMVRHYRNKGLPILIRYSIEGSTLEQNGPMLDRTIARRVALTIKPANKSAISGVISDGEDDSKKVSESTQPEDPLAFLIGTKKHENPDQRRLGGSPTIACDPEIHDVSDLTDRLNILAKTITAGNYNAAPGSLTGGAALQREDFGRELHDVGFAAKAKAALRDYDPDKHGPFKEYAKHSLPEASDSFLDRFAEAVGDWKVTKQQMLAKAEDEEVQEPGGRITRSGSGMSTGSTAFKAKQKKYEHKLKGIQAAVAAPKQVGLPGMGVVTDEGPALPPAESPEFKVRTGKRLKHGEAYFDHGGGVLHTADGRFKVYIPDLNDRGYGEILKDPGLNHIHDTALKNWVMVHKTMRAGKAPQEMVALASLFSAMSPNTAVPMQELAYGHLMDMMGPPTGKGGFEGLDPTKELSRKELARYAKEWNSISKGQHLPAWERDHFAKRTSGIWTEEGRRYIIGLGAQKWGGVKNYHELHETLVDLVAKHGTDARTIAGLLNDMKQRAGTKKQGEDPDVKGFAPKTIRYLLGMMGAGNVVVPDTHFIRHTFGLHTADPRSDVLKKYLWNEKNEPLLAEIDKYYLAHHPAVAHTRAKIQQQFGEDLGEQALFPSFWLHWLTIQPHEKRRGWFERGQAKNAETDHGVFWNAVKRVLTKYGIPHDHRLIKHEMDDGGSMAARVAHATKELENQFGFVPATLALYSTMIPAVLHNKELAKAEALAEQLQELAKGEPKVKKPKAVPFSGKMVFPGELEILEGPHKGKFPLLDIGSEWHHVDDGGSVRKVKAGAKSYRINSEPKASGLGFQLVDAKKHGAPGLSEHPDQQAMLHGMDLAKEALPRQVGERRGMSAAQAGNETGWRQSRAGHISYVKPNFAMNSHLGVFNQEGFTTAHREATFHNLAKNFFKLGQHVPTTAVFHHPTTGQPYSAQRRVEDVEHYEPSNPEHGATIERLRHMGQLDKLALMDMILDQVDRHSGNYMLTPKKAPYIHLNDNGLSMYGEDEVPNVPHYWSANTGNEWVEEPLHPEAVAWAQKLNPQKLGDMMERLGVPQKQRAESVRRLGALQNRLANKSPDGKPFVFKNPPVTKGAAYYSPFLETSYGRANVEDVAAAHNPATEDRTPSGAELGRMT
jgi:hypothetical protein